MSFVEEEQKPASVPIVDEDMELSLFPSTIVGSVLSENAESKCDSNKTKILSLGIRTSWALLSTIVVGLLGGTKRITLHHLGSSRSSLQQPSNLNAKPSISSYILMAVLT